MDIDMDIDLDLGDDFTAPEPEDSATPMNVVRA